MREIPGQQVIDTVRGRDGNMGGVGLGLWWKRNLTNQSFGQLDCQIVATEQRDSLERLDPSSRRTGITAASLIQHQF